MALELHEIEALTQDYFDPNYYNQTLLGNVLFYKLEKKAKRVDGAYRIREVLPYGTTKGGSFNATDTFDTSKYEEHTAARFKWGYYYEPVTYDMDDQVENSGAAAEVSVLNSKLNDAPKNLREGLAADLYASTDYGASGRKLLGLMAICSTTSTYGGVAVADITQWVAGSVNTTSESISFGVLRNLRTACMVGDGVESEFTMFMTTRALMDKVRAMSLPHEQLANTEMAKLGFKNVVFEGTEIFGDYKCTSGYLFGLNEHYLNLWIHNKFDFKRMPWSCPNNQPTKFTTSIIVTLQLTTNRRMAHGVHSALS